MANAKLFVGGLSWGTDAEAMKAAFAQFGEIKDAVVINDRETGRSKGFGFITFATVEQAQAAQAGMDGKDLDGRTLRVNEANERPPREKRY